MTPRRRGRSDRPFLLGFFVLLILIGSIALALPMSWNGPAPLSYIDALFTATSAVCVTGLITVDTANYTMFGKVVIAVLIQLGGLGIISFATIHLLIPNVRLSLSRLQTIQGYYLGGIENEPRRIVGQILAYTFVIQAAGAVALSFAFHAHGVPNPIFAGIFHSISAFCNAGFSTFSTSLQSFWDAPEVLISIMTLIVCGGLSFVVLQNLLRNLLRRIARRRDRLLFHSRVVLGMSAALIAVGSVLFFVFESRAAYAAMPSELRVLNSVFQAITPRTAGFDSVVQSTLSVPSKYLTMFLMFVGGAPGSIAGGIKVTTLFIIIVFVLRGSGNDEDVQVLQRRLSHGTLHRTMLYVSKAVVLLFVCIFLLTTTESTAIRRDEMDLTELVFEAISAFGTVGLSLGITSSLSTLGKLVIIFTMFAGRVGLVAMALPSARRRFVNVSYPEGEVMVG